MSVSELFPRNYALTATLMFTGLRFCHASALKWEDLDEARGVLHIRRKQRWGHVGPVSRRKRAPAEYPLHPQLAEILKAHRWQLVGEQAPGLGEGWMFPSRDGELRRPSSLWHAWQRCLKEIGVTRRFTVHGLRRTFNDLSRRANIDAMVTRSLTGHVTERMQEHYSTIGLDEQRLAVAGVVRLLTAESGDRSGDRDPKTKTPTL